MAIAAKRFSVLDQEMNVPVMDFSGIPDSSILNSPLLEIKQGSASLDELVQSSIQDVQLQIPAVPAPPVSDFNILDFARSTKDSVSQVVSLQKMAPTQVTNYISSMGIGDQAQARKLAGLLSRCATPGMGTGLPGKPYDPSVNCGNGKVSVDSTGRGSSCDTGSYSDLINKLTNGLYNSGFRDINKLIQGLMALSGYGMNMGMCGVFGALVSPGSPFASIPTDALSRASGSLMDAQALAGNVTGVFDVTKTVSGMDLYPLSSNPEIISDVANNFTCPAGIGDDGLVGLGQSTYGTFDALDTGWNVSGYDGTFSTAFADDYSSDLSTVNEAMLMDNDLTLDDLDLVPEDDMTFQCGSYNGLPTDDSGFSVKGADSFSQYSFDQPLAGNLTFNGALA